MHFFYDELHQRDAGPVHVDARKLAHSPDETYSAFACGQRDAGPGHVDACKLAHSPGETYSAFAYGALSG